MKSSITEEQVENVALDIFKELGYKVIYGPDIAPDGDKPERKSYQDVVLIDRLRKAIDKINPNLPSDAKEDALKQVLRVKSPKLITNNQNFHTMLFDGIEIEYRKNDRIIGDKVWLFDFKKPQNNEFLAINQFTIIENNINRRPDVILFINGIPLVLFEIKNPADEKATIWKAFSQLETYKQEISTLFTYNEILVVTDGWDARAGTITSGKSRFMPWKTIQNNKPSKTMTQMEVLIRGMFEKQTILDIIRHFIVFEKEKELVKKLAAYHQYNAVNKAIESTIKATKTNKKAGVVWHTQGSGKSLSMVFYTGKLTLSLDNPTIVLLTDRNDLDDQLFNNFANCQQILRQSPIQANTRQKLTELLKVSSGGIVFTTIQKFFPEDNREQFQLLSKRSNIIVIADEAHRSQYGFGAKILKKQDEAIVRYGFAKYLRDALPNASFIGFTGTPIERSDKSTPAVFGKYVDVYDIQQAVEDGATVRIYYENRLAKLDLKPEERPKIDSDFEEVTEGEESSRKELLKSKWAQLAKVVGAPPRIKRIAKDIVNHFEERQIIDGKGMIVCMSRRICVDLYNEIIKLRPNWHNKDDDKGFLKVVMTGSASDPADWQQHIRNKQRRRELANRMKDTESDMKLTIVRDMWLTGFDCPNLHTMYVDKPMNGHNLMQAIARVNRVYKDKQGGLIVDYIGIGVELKKALADYTESGGKGKPTFNQEDAVAVMKEKYEIILAMLHGFNYKLFFKLNPKEKMSFIPKTMEFILKQKDGKERYLKYVTELLRAFSLSVPHKDAMTIKDDVGFFQAIKSSIVKTTETKGQYTEDLDTAINQILSRAIVSDRIIDIFEAAGIKKPDISILSDKFLEDVHEMPQKNLAFEMLKKLLNDQIRVRMKKNLVQARSFREMLENAIRRYTNRSIEAAQVVEELITLAKDMKKAENRGENLGLSEDETAFYDALAENESAIQVLGDEILKKMACEITEIIRNNKSVDWTLRESIQAKLRVLVKRLLKRYGYPPDQQKRATELVMEQANLAAEAAAS
ncbi:MAG: type I restriction endonuclease subunit R [archaeon]